MVFEKYVQPAVRPRPRGQALGEEPAREDAGAPLMRHWLQLIFKDHQPTGRRDHSSPVASATIEPGWRIAHTHNVRRNQSLALALVLVGSIVATRHGKYLTRNRGLMVFEN